MVYLFPISVLLLPSFLIGSIYSHIIAKGTILIFTLYLGYNYFYLKKKGGFQIQKELLFLAFFYLIRIISLVSQDNVDFILNTAEDLLFYVIFIIYCTLLWMRDEEKQMLKWSIFIIFLVNLLNNLLLFLFKESYLSLLQPFIHEGDYGISLMNLQRERIFFNNFPELLIPFVFILIPQYKFISLLLIGLAFFIVLVSGFRTNLVMIVFALVLSFVVFKKGAIHFSHFLNTNKRDILFVMVGVIILGTMIASSISSQYVRFTALDRLISSEDGETSTIESRLDHIRQSMDLFVSSPLFGVGTDRFKEYLPNRKDKQYFSRSNLAVLNDARDPHNFLFTILSEGGLITLIIYLLFLKKSFIIDLRRKTVGSIAFWTLFLYSLANPVAGFLQFNLLLILFRFI